MLSFRISVFQCISLGAIFSLMVLYYFFSVNPVVAQDAVDSTPPTFSNVNLVSDNSFPDKASAGQTVTLSFTSSETIETPTVTFSVGGTAAGGAVTVENVVDPDNPDEPTDDWRAYFVVAAGEAGAVTFTLDADDTSSNSAVQVTSATGSVTVDTTAPTISETSIVARGRSTSTASSTSNEEVRLTFTTSELTGAPEVSFFVGGVPATNQISRVVATADKGSQFGLVVGTEWEVSFHPARGESGTVTFTLDSKDLAGNSATQVTTATGSVTVVGKDFPTTNSASEYISNVVLTSTGLYGDEGKKGDDITLSFTVDATDPEVEGVDFIDVKFSVGARSPAGEVTTSNTGGDWTSTFTLQEIDIGVVTFVITIFINEEVDGETVLVSREMTMVTSGVYVLAYGDGVVASPDIEQPFDLDLAAADDTGSSNSDNITNKTTDFTITGCSETNSIVQLHAQHNRAIGKSAVANGSSCGSGLSEFSIELANLTEGVTSLRSSATSFGRHSTFRSDKAQLAITVDLSGPEFVNVDLVSDNSDKTKAVVGDEVRLSFDARELIQEPTVTFSIGASAAKGEVTLVNIPVDPRFPQFIPTIWEAYFVVEDGEEGEVAFTLDADDVAGNSGEQVDTLSRSSAEGVTVVIEDVTAPTFSDVTLVSNNSDTTKAVVGNEVTLSFTASEEIETPTVTFSVGVSAVAVGDITVAEAGSITNGWTASFTVAAGAGGAVTFTLDADDTSSNSATQVTTAVGSVLVGEVVSSVASPTNLDLAAADDSGDSDSDDITKTTTGLTISGCAVADSTVQLYVDNNSVEAPVIASGATTGCATGEKIFTTDIGLSGDGVYAVTARATTSAGTSEPSTSLQVTVDTTPPTVSSVNIESDNSVDSDIATAGDNVILSFTVDEASSTPEVVFSLLETIEREIFTGHPTYSTNEVEIVRDVTYENTQGTNAWKASIDVVSGESVPLAFTLDVDDLAGNSAEQVSVADTGSVKLISPPTDLDLTEVGDSGSSDSDNITNKTSGLVIEGCAAADTLVKLYSDGVLITYTNSSSEQVEASGTATGRDCVGKTGKTFIISTHLPEGSHNINARATLGNFETENSGDDTNPSLSLVVDTTAPTFSDVTIVSSNAADTTTASASDTITLSFAASEAIETPTVTFSIGGTAAGGAVTVAEESAVENGWTAVFTVAAGESGAVTFTLDADDTAGNSATQVVNPDTGSQVGVGGAPTVDPPTDLDLAAEDDSGNSNSDNITNKTSALTISGCAVADSTVQLYEGAGTLGDAATADGGECGTGGKRFSTDIDLAGDGLHVIFARATSGTDTSFNSETLEITIDTHRALISEVLPVTDSSALDFHVTLSFSQDPSNQYSETLIPILGGRCSSFSISHSITTSDEPLSPLGFSTYVIETEGATSKRNYDDCTLLLIDGAGNESVLFNIDKFRLPGSGGGVRNRGSVFSFVNFSNYFLNLNNPEEEEEVDEPIEVEEFMAPSNLVSLQFSLGQSSPTIKRIQVILNDTNCPVSLSGAGSKGQETEYFGSRTQSAVKCYQRENGLAETGTIDAETYETLNNEIVRRENERLENEITRLKKELLKFITLLNELYG